jgi:hypothetical protein
MKFRSYAAAMAGIVSFVAAFAPGTAAAGSPDRWQRVTFEGVSLRVPASWPVINLRRHPSACPRLDVHAVYLGRPGPDPICPAGLLGKTEAVMIEPVNRNGPDVHEAMDQSRTAGKFMLRNPDWAVTHTITDILPGHGAQVSISYRADRALALAIQASITVGSTAGPAELRGPAAITAVPPQGVVKGLGFDACAAPSVSTMTSWLASRYRSVGVYIGGVNRACAQANLTSAWLATIESQGWHYFPIYPGLQSSCVQASGDATIDTGHAAAEGVAAADDAAVQAHSLGIPPGTPLIYDMEAYLPACDSQVITFLSAWDSELHVRGYSAGVYESFSNIGALVGAVGSMTEPDVVDYADWDAAATTTSSYMPASLWTKHQRVHQYLGNNQVSYGGVSLNIDSDYLDVNMGGKPVPINHAGFRISVAINSNTTAEWFSRGASNALVHSWQQPVGSLTWSAVHNVGNSPRSIASNPSVTAQSNGVLTVFADDVSGLVQHAWQQAGFPNDWEWGKPLPAPPGQVLHGTDPAAVLLPSGDVGVFQTTASGAVAVIRQIQPNGNASWTTWTKIKGSCASSPVPVVDASHKVDVFCRTAAGRAAFDTWNGTSWSGWTVLPVSPAKLTGVPAVAINGSGQTELVTAAVGGGLVVAWQSGAAGTWTWGSPLAGAGTGTTIKNSPAVAAWPGGEVVIYAQLADGQPGYISQQGTSGSDLWTRWSDVGQVPGGAMLGSPAGWLNYSGAPGVAVLDHNLRIAVASYAAGSWSGWTEAGVVSRRARARRR